MTYFKLNRQYVIFRPEYFGGILSDVRMSNFIILNEVTTDIINYMLAGFSTTEIVIRMQEKYRQVPASIEADIKEIVKELIDGDYFINTTEHSMGDIQEYYFNKEMTCPVEVNIYPHYFCNQKCDFCFIPDHKSNDVMTTQLFDRILNCPGLEWVLSYNILGGEPFLNFPLIKHILKVVPQNKKVCISTNGSCDISDEDILYLSQFSNLWIQVSLESGIAKEHDSIVHNEGAFDRAISFISRLQNRHIKVSVNAVYSGVNQDGIVTLAKLLEEMNLPFMSVTLCYPDKNYTIQDYYLYRELCEKYDIFIDELGKIINNRMEISSIKENLFIRPEQRMQMLENSTIPLEFMNCHGGVISIEITPNGDIYPCTLMLEDKKYLMGNITREDYTEIRNRFKKQKIHLSQVHSNCLECEEQWACWSPCILIRKSSKDNCKKRGIDCYE